MLKEKFILSILLISTVLISSCSEKKVAKFQEESLLQTTQIAESTYSEPHNYGGWYCPDNFKGFPPMDIQELDLIPVVINRLPTKEETQNGSSLMFFDTAKILNAKPLEIKLPRVAKMYSNHSKMDELVIVIQAVTIGNDSVIGFRYPNGGNGTSWLDEVTFLSDIEVNDMGPTPFVYLKSEINSSKEKIWKAICTTEFGKRLGEKFNQKAFFESEWTNESTTRLNFQSIGLTATGIVTTVWGNLYLQIDYDNNGSHFSEKILVLEDVKKNTAELHFVSGPYPEEIENQNVIWKEWLQKVKVQSEVN
ncbi:MAG: hypothetical protein ACJASF_001600 [Vicingaceae bacterium]|jgi:hypothetical protein